MSLENPAGAYTWRMAGVTQWLADVRGRIVRVDYCRFGSPHRKATKLAFSEQSVPDFSQRCANNHHHDVLSGWTGGVARTSMASSYPPALVEVWADAVDTWYQQIGRGLGLPQHALELFAGEGTLGEALRRHGWVVVRHELKDGRNILEPAEMEMLVAAVASMCFAYVHSGTVCTTLSLARHPALRSPEEVCGKARLDGVSAALCSEGNEFIRRRLIIADAAAGSTGAVPAGRADSAGTVGDSPASLHGRWASHVTDPPSWVPSGGGSCRRVGVWSARPGGFFLPAHVRQQAQRQFLSTIRGLQNFHI